MTRYLVLIPVIVPLLFGCAGPSHGPNGAKLSQAMGKASDTYHGDRTIETPYGDQPTLDSDINDSGSRPSKPENNQNQTPSPPHTPQESNGRAASGPENGLTLGFAAGTGIMKSDDLEPLYHFDISLGGYLKKKQQIELFLGFGYAQVHENGPLDSSIDDGVDIFSIGARYKYFFTPRYTFLGCTPRYTFLGCYLTVGLAYDWMGWSYKHDIEVDGRSIDSDWLGGIEVFAGMGFNLAQTRHYHFGVEVLPA
jgi:hypothetical protein